MKPKAAVVRRAVVALVVVVAFLALLVGRFVPHSHDAGRSFHSHDAGATYHGH